MRLAVPDVQGKKGGRGGRGAEDRQRRQPLGILLHGEGGRLPVASLKARPRRRLPEMLIGDSTGRKPERFQTDMAAFSKDFSKCILCKNCRDMCPVCYCIDCLFNGDEYLPKGDALLNKVLRTGSTDHAAGEGDVPSHQDVPCVPDLRGVRRL